MLAAAVNSGGGGKVRPSCIRASMVAASVASFTLVTLVIPPFWSCRWVISCYPNPPRGGLSTSGCLLRQAGRAVHGGRPLVVDALLRHEALAARRRELHAVQRVGQLRHRLAHVDGEPRPRLDAEAARGRLAGSREEDDPHRQRVHGRIEQQQGDRKSVV